MRSLIFFWGLPLGFFWSWYYLSMNDISFGTVFFSRQMHDMMKRMKKAGGPKQFLGRHMPPGMMPR